MRRYYRILKIWKADKFRLCKRISKFGYLFSVFYAPLTIGQLKHNADIDSQIIESEREHAEYIKQCNEKSCLPVRAKRIVIGVRYV